MKRSAFWGVSLLLLALPASGQSEIVDVLRPEIAVAPDGSYAIAAEVLTRSGASGFEQWKIAVQRYDPSGTAVGDLYLFEGQSGSVTIWTSDFLELPELEYMPDGTLLVLMEHRGDIGIGGDNVRAREPNLTAILPDGTVANDGRYFTFSFPALQPWEVYRARMDVDPVGNILISVDGIGDASNLNVVAIKLLDADGAEVIEEVVPHIDDVSANAFHIYGDIATNGDLVASVWTRCPIIDQQGNAEQCDIDVQFLRDVPVGTNQIVNDDVPLANLNTLPSVDMNAAGQSVVAWYDSRTGPLGDVFAQRFDASGQKVGRNIQVSTTEGEIRTDFDRPEVAVQDDGSFMVVWYDSSAAGFQARGRQFGSDNQPLGPPFRLSTDPNLETGVPDLTTDGANYYYTWVATDGEIYANVQGGGGVSITPNESDQVDRPEVSLDLYPNPFSQHAVLDYRLAEVGPVRIEVYDLLGRLVDRPVDRVQGLGRHQVQLRGADLPVGTYFVRLHLGDRTEVRKLVRVEQ